MHENVKFTLRLDENIHPIAPENLGLIRKNLEPNPEVVGQLIPFEVSDKKQISDWQPIFGDVKYGTDHVIYAKFCGNKERQENDEGVDETVFNVKNIQLYIQNYTGPVTIGFNQQNVVITEEDIPEGHHDGDIRYKKRKQYTLRIGLEALKSDLEDLFMVDPDKFARLNDDNLTIKEGDTLMVETWFSPANPDYTKIYTNRLELKSSPFVDELFMERIGDDVVVTHKGLDHLRWLRREHKDLISAKQLKSARANLTRQLRNFRSTRGRRGDFLPCQRVYSNCYIS